MGSNNNTTEIEGAAPYGDKVPVIRNWKHLERLEGLGIVDPHEPVYTLEPIYQKGKLIAYLKIQRLPRIQDSGRGDGKKIDAGYGLEELGYNKPIEGLPE